MLTIIMNSKTVTVLANRRALLVSRNAGKNLKAIAKTILFATNYVEFSSKFVCFRRNFSLRNGTVLGSKSDYR